MYLRLLPPPSQCGFIFTLVEAMKTSARYETHPATRDMLLCDRMYCMWCGIFVRLSYCVVFVLEYRRWE